MVGVPNSRACDACRRQKKKCDLAKPCCARCLKQGVPCVGGGVQRIKFLLITQADADGSATSARFANPWAVVRAKGASRVAGFFIHRLGVHDVRYDVSAYGGFLHLLPQRAGHSVALDAAMDAFSEAFSHSTIQERPVELLRRYGVAIRAVRVSLRKSSTAVSIDTLSAIYLLMLIQAWRGNNQERIANHEAGIAHLLGAVVERGITDEFEAKAVPAMLIPVIFGSMTNDQIPLNPTLVDAISMQLSTFSKPDTPSELETSSGNDPVRFKSLQLSHLGKIPLFVRHPESYKEEIVSLYEAAKQDCSMISSKLDLLTPDTCPPDSFRGRIRRDYQSACAMATSLALLLINILAAFDPLDDTLPLEAERYIQNIIGVCEDATVYKPIGSGSMTGALTVALGVSVEPMTRTRITNLIFEHYESFKGDNWKRMADWWHYKLVEIRLKLNDQTLTDEYEEARAITARHVSLVQCSASHNYVELAL